jgi:hypothetical protein
VVGDFNSRPNEPTYSVMLAAGFADTAAITGEVGATCCQAVDLSNTVSQLTNRFDYVFERNFSSIDAAFLIGDTPFENVRPLWPSDHAGVVATVDVPEPPAGMLVLTALLLLGFRQFRTRSRGGSGASFGIDLIAYPSAGRGSWMRNPSGASRLPGSREFANANSFASSILPQHCQQ